MITQQNIHFIIYLIMNSIEHEKICTIYLNTMLIYNIKLLKSFVTTTTLHFKNINIIK